MWFICQSSSDCLSRLKGEWSLMKSSISSTFRSTPFSTLPISACVGGG